MIKAAVTEQAPRSWTDAAAVTTGKSIPPESWETAVLGIGSFREREVPYCSAAGTAAANRCVGVGRRERQCFGWAASRGRWLVPFGASLTVRARGSINETGKRSGERATVSEPVPAAT